MSFEIESNQDVLLDGVGLLKAGEPHKLTEEELIAFRVAHRVSFAEARFAPGIKVTYNLEDAEGGE